MNSPVRWREQITKSAPWRPLSFRTNIVIHKLDTREAYARAIKQFLDWCRDGQRPILRGYRHIQFSEISSLAIAAYVERHPGSAPTINQHFAAFVLYLAGW